VEVLSSRVLLHPADLQRSISFYATTLDTLLQYLGAKTLILTGIAGNS